MKSALRVTSIVHIIALFIARFGAIFSTDFSQTFLCAHAKQFVLQRSAPLPEFEASAPRQTQRGAAFTPPPPPTFLCIPPRACIEMEDLFLIFMQDCIV